MLPLAENPAVADPARTLTGAEQAALMAIGFYRRQARRAGLVEIGPRKVTNQVIARLCAHRLIKGDPPHLTLTVAGQLAVDKLRQGSA